MQRGENTTQGLARVQ